ncbi:MAG: hypothetical protein E4H31_01950, partial [Dehalococcoidia bacterium]
MNSLTVKLGVALVLVAVIAVAAMALLTNQYTKNEFQSYIFTNPMFTESTSNTLAIYYLENQNSWDGVNSILSSLLAFNGDRLVMADSSGVIVGDTSGDLIGRTVSQSALSGGIYVQLYQPHTIIGQFFYISHTTGSGGMGGGMGGGGMGPGGTGTNIGNTSVVVTNA